MIYIPLENNPPNQGWLDRADAVTQQLINAPDVSTRNTIIDANQSLWGELKQHLCNLNHRKCWYSESINDGAHCHVDHFRPKKKVLYEDDNTDQGGYWWLAFDWMNYRYSGPAPNVRKKDYFHVNARKAMNYGDSLENEDIRFLDPIKLSDPKKLSFDSSGEVRSINSNTTTRDYIQVKYTIRRRNLNDEGLIEGRKTKYRDASTIIQAVSKLTQLQNITHDTAREIKIDEAKKRLHEMASRHSEYSAAVKFCLKSSGYDWALDIAIDAA